MKTLFYILALGGFVGSCVSPSEEAQFRNIIRDAHPYAELMEVEHSNTVDYQVNDTLRNQIWIYRGNAKNYTRYRVNINHVLQASADSTDSLVQLSRTQHAIIENLETAPLDTKAAKRIAVLKELINDY